MHWARKRHPFSYCVQSRSSTQNVGRAVASGDGPGFGEVSHRGGHNLQWTEVSAELRRRAPATSGSGAEEVRRVPMTNDSTGGLRKLEGEGERYGLRTRHRSGRSRALGSSYTRASHRNSLRNSRGTPKLGIGPAHGEALGLEQIECVSTMSTGGRIPSYAEAEGREKLSLVWRYFLSVDTERAL